MLPLMLPEADTGRFYNPEAKTWSSPFADAVGPDGEQSTADIATEFGKLILGEPLVDIQGKPGTLNQFVVVETEPAKLTVHPTRLRR